MTAPPADAAFDLLPVSVARVAADLTLVSANAHLCRALGRPAAEVVGRSCAELGSPPAGWAEWVRVVRQVLDTGRPADCQYVCDTPAGERLVLIRCAPAAAGDVLAVGVENDEVRQLRGALAVSEGKFQAFMDHLPAIAWLRDADERYLFVNREYRRLMRVTDADRVGKHPTEVFGPEVAAAVLANDARLAAAGTVRAEEAVPDADGVMRHWLNVKFTVPGPDGRPQFGGIGLDISAEKKLQADRQALDARLQQAHRAEALAVLAAGVAHDFNNILCAVMGFAGLGRELVRDSHGPLQDCFTQIELAADRAAELCRQMLAYAGGRPTPREPVDLAAVAAETLKLLSGGALRRVRVTTDFPPDLPAVPADPTGVRQVVLNLLTNAAEATADGPDRAVGVSAGVEVDPPDLPAGRYVWVRVADNGAGMTPEVEARAFEPFFTSKFTGRGLGLASVAGIVRDHRGLVRVATAPGAGCAFTVLLPAG